MEDNYLESSRRTCGTLSSTCLRVPCSTSTSRFGASWTTVRENASSWAMPVTYAQVRLVSAWRDRAPVLCIN